MRYIHRELAKAVHLAARNFPAVVLTGPRRSGKTSLLRRLLPSASYFLMEDPTVTARFKIVVASFMQPTAVYRCAPNAS